MSVAQRNEELLRQQIEARRGNEKIADQIHEAVTGELSFIARLAQRQSEQDGRSDEDRRLWTEVNQSAMHVLDDVHRVIDTLDGREQKIQAELPQQPYLQQVRDVLAQGDERLRELGFHGESKLITVDVTTPLSRRHRELSTSLLTEIYANIVKHAKPGCDYSLSVTVDLIGTEIVQTNGDAAESDMHGGHGIDQYDRTLRKLGGRIETGIEDDDTWVLFALIPADA